MKTKLIKLFSFLFQKIDKVLCRLRIKRPKIIVYMDGGICSQMLIYIHGQYYAEKGFDVYYDTLWFQRNGKDQYGNMERTFELIEMWPNIDFKTPTKWQRKWYLLFFKAKRTNADWLPTPNSVKHSLYLNDYWNIPLEDHNRLYKQKFNIQTASIPTRNFNLNFNKSIVGVHVRRGDLAKGDNPIYGGVTDGYFIRAIDFCNRQFKPEKYIFFSDEPDWVEENICNQLEQSYEIMRGNKAWEDLWILSQCPIIVSSQGSFGRVAARLNPKSVLIQCDNNYAVRDRENTYYIL